MKLIMKHIKASLLALTVLWGSAFSANASLITQDIFIGSTDILLGTITVDLDDSLFGTGIVDTNFDPGLTLHSFVILGTTFMPMDLVIYDFGAVLDTDNVMAGLEFLAFDIDETGFIDNWAYQLLFDEFDPFSNFVDIFNENGDLVFASFDVRLGTATVNAPATLSLALLGLLALAYRRKA